MLLKIFTKRTTGGELVETDLEWKDWYFEGQKIYKKPLMRGEEGEPQEQIGFEFLVVSNENSERVTFFSSMMGYELLNDQGVIVDKYVTVTK